MVPKFRAWDTTNKEIFKDTFAITESGQVVVVDQSSVFVSPDYVFVDNLVIMQSTGLFDRNNKEIFEGDIITNGKDVMCMKRHNTLGFYVEQKGKVEFIADSAVLEEFEENAKEIADILEIIGNIYENPELLEAIK
ncbi:YopX family protein [Streptococcus pseudopneumoniae]|uniref:YopX family protein n=1 Tax=Streptococcus pseudopneumoniae TaxID=257758 RepID=UPI00066AEB9D|nr:YopX family protein [Streptococcus pseudopneumoniae]